MAAGPPLPNDEQRCTATSTGSGNRCRLFAIRGGTVCWKHGGRAPQVRRKAQERLAMAEAEQSIRAELQRLGDVEPTTIDPVQTLLERVAIGSAMCRILEREIGKLEQLHGPDHLGDAVPDVRVRLLRDWSDQVARHCKLLIDARVDERRIRLAEGMGETLALTIRAILEELGVLEDPRVPGIVRRHLLAAGGVE